MERGAGRFRFHDHKISLQAKGREGLPPPPIPQADSEASPWDRVSLEAWGSEGKQQLSAGGSLGLLF